MNFNTSAKQPTVTYAQMIQQPQFPTKEQAIVLDSVDGSSIRDYAVKIGELIEPENIRYISRISHARVCLYLSTKEIADKLTENRTKVNIGQQILEIRPLISKAKRIILSNVCPIIPHNVILEELFKLNVQPTSQITFIRAGMNETGFSHILSFRRQIYVQPEDVEKLPPSIQISYDNTVYWIYISTEKLTCFLCKEEGHLAKFCKSFGQSQIETTNKESANKGDNNVDKNPSSGEEKQIEQSKMPPPTSTPSKRPAAHSLSTTSSNPNSTNDFNDKIVKKRSNRNKKVKKTEDEILPCGVNNQLEPAKYLCISKTSDFPLNFEKLVEFLTESYGSQNVYEVATKYTKDISALCSMLSEVRKTINDTNMKSRLNRIVKRLLNEDFSEASSESSSFAEESEA